MDLPNIYLVLHESYLRVGDMGAEFCADPLVLDLF